MAEGAPDGESRLLPEARLRFGEVTIRFSSPDPAVRFELTPPHTGFLAESGEATCDVVCRVGDATPGEGEVLFDSGGTWELRATPAGGDEVAFRTATPDGGRAPLMRVRLDAGLRRAEVVRIPQPGDPTVIPVGFPLDEYLAARLLARSGAVILHACAVVQEGEALVFMGHSGAGKSTIAELAERAGATVLSDDRTILRPGDGGVTAWGTPWHGSYRRGLAAGAPVRAIFLLVQAPENEVIDLAPARAFKEMLVRLVQPTIDTAELMAGLDALERIVERVPAAELCFRPEVAAYALARRASTVRPAGSRATFMPGG